MSDMMTFPDTWEEYERSYGFYDTEEVYTNGSRLIPSFRVSQWLNHEAEQHGRVFQEIVVEYPSISIYPEYEGKPYFSIKYVEDGQGYIGYGTYKPEVLSEYMKKYFMPSAEPEVIRCKDCKHIQTWRSEESAKKFGQIYECARSVLNCPKPEDFCSYAEMRGEQK